MMDSIWFVLVEVFKICLFIGCYGFFIILRFLNMLMSFLWELISLRVILVCCIVFFWLWVLMRVYVRIFFCLLRIICMGYL